VTLENILADFQLLDDWEDRYRYVIEPTRPRPAPAAGSGANGGEQSSRLRQSGLARD
jgi:sulfur transfer protein SufE